MGTYAPQPNDPSKAPPEIRPPGTLNFKWFFIGILLMLGMRAVTQVWIDSSIDRLSAGAEKTKAGVGEEFSAVASNVVAEAASVAAGEEESDAVSAIGAVASAQQAFKDGGKAEGGKQEYGTLEQLGTAELVAADLAAGKAGAYALQSGPATKAPGAAFFASATPTKPGLRHLFTNQTGKVYASKDPIGFSAETCEPPPGVSELAESDVQKEARAKREAELKARQEKASADAGAGLSSMLAGGAATVLGYFVLVPFCYFLGALIVAWKSPGRTLLEPAMAAVVVVFIMSAYAVWKASAGHPSLSAIISSRAICGSVFSFMTALFGALIGEKVQHSSG